MSGHVTDRRGDSVMRLQVRELDGEWQWRILDPSSSHPIMGGWFDDRRAAVTVGRAQIRKRNKKVEWKEVAW